MLHLQSTPTPIAAYVVDVRDESTIEAAVRQVSEAQGELGLDVLLNCAGVASCSPFELATTAEFKSVFEVRECRE